MWPFPAKPLPGKPVYLNRMQCGTVARFTEAVVPIDDAEVTPEEVALELDRFLSLYRSRRKWRVKYVIFGLEFMPIAAGWPPLSLMTLKTRRKFVNQKLRTCHGLWGKVAMGKQLILLAFYGLRKSDDRMGFTPFAQRPRAKRLLRFAPQAGMRA